MKSWSGNPTKRDEAPGIIVMSGRFRWPRVHATGTVSRWWSVGSGWLAAGLVLSSVLAPSAFASLSSASLPLASLARGASSAEEQIGLGMSQEGPIGEASGAERAGDSEPEPPAAPAVVDPALFANLDYRMIGPHRGGRVTAVAGVEQYRDVFYMGATGGGVWKTDDAGLTWRTLSDQSFATSAIGAIDVADSDPSVVYVGTGSACIRSNIITGRGVYRSNDGGENWLDLGLRQSGAVGDLVVHPTNPEVVYVAALGQIFGANEQRGVFRSRDGGATWERVLYVSDQVGAVDLALDRSNPRRIFAAMWRAERKPWTIISGSEDSGLYSTLDGGDTWEKVEGGLPGGLVGKIAVEISPADPDRVWALVEAPGQQRGLYRSDDGGRRWRQINDQVSLTYRPWYYTHLTADPLQREVVYVNNETFWVSTNGGESFEARATPHGDNHALWIHPSDSKLMVQGNDGGANVSRDGGRTWSPQWNQPTAELYQVAVDDAFPYRVYGAQQDNSTISVPSRVTRRPLDPKQNWEEVSGCETGPIVPHPENPALVLGGCKGRHSIYDRRTGQVRQYWVYPHFNYGHTTSDMPYRFQRTAPMIVSPHDPDVIYHASHVLHRSRDEGKSWSVISPDLTRNDPEHQMYSGGPITRDITGEEIYSAIYAVAESPLEQGVLWVGANDGPIHISRDGGENWTEITPPDLPRGGRVNRIDASAHARGRAYVAVYRFQLDDWQPYVYSSDDYGASWRRLTNGSNGIPADVPVRVVREDPERSGLLYAGTEFGIYVSFDDGGSWQSLQLDLPVVPVTDIQVHRGDLVLSTMGRSFWILDNVSSLRALAGQVAATSERPVTTLPGDDLVRLLEPRSATRARWVGSLERSFPGHAPDYGRAGLMIDYQVLVDQESLELEILSSAGVVVRRIALTEGSNARSQPSQGMRGPRAAPQPAELSATQGLHRYVWDLRHDGPVAVATGVPAGRGPLVSPGTYQARLLWPGGSAVESFEIEIDPRVQAVGITEDDIEAQESLELEVRDARSALRRGVRLIRDLEVQLEELARRSEQIGREESLVDSSRELASALEEVEKALIQTVEGKVGAELEPQLDAQLGYLSGMISAADQRPGRDAYERFSDVRDELDVQLTRLERLIDEDVAQLNRRFKTSDVPAIFVERE